MKKTRQLMDDLFESDHQPQDLRHSIEHFMRLGFDLEGARDQVRKATNPRELKTVQHTRDFAGQEQTRPIERPAALNMMMALPAQRPAQEANFHSPEERTMLDKIRKGGPRRRPVPQKSKLTHRI